MADTLFDAGREGFLGGEIDFDNATIKAFLLRGYTFDPTDKFMSDVTAAGTVDLDCCADRCGMRVLCGSPDIRGGWRRRRGCYRTAADHVHRFGYRPAGHAQYR